MNQTNQTNQMIPTNHLTDPTNQTNISSKKYRKYKLKLKSLERVNYDKIMLIPCAGNKNWYELAEHSALIYYYKVCQKLHRKIKFYDDVLSFYDKYDIGYIRALGIDNVRQNLKKANLYRKETIIDNIVVFELNTRYKKTELDRLTELETSRREQNLTPADTGTLSPILHQALVSLALRLRQICTKTYDQLTRPVLGENILALAVNLLELYHQITALSQSPQPLNQAQSANQAQPQSKTLAKLNEMRTIAYHLIIKLRIATELKIWDYDVCAKLTNPLTEAIRLIESEIKTILKESKWHRS